MDWLDREKMKEMKNRQEVEEFHARHIKIDTVFFILVYSSVILIVIILGQALDYVLEAQNNIVYQITDTLGERICQDNYGEHYIDYDHAHRQRGSDLRSLRVNCEFHTLAWRLSDG